MPIAEAGFFFPDGATVPGGLLQHGPTVQVLVCRLAIPPAFQGVAPSGNFGIAPSESVPGLVDTGAAQSCIDSALAARLQLPIVDRIALSGVNSAHQHDVFAAQIVVPTLGIMEVGRFAGVHLVGGQQPHQVLLGRTFLQNVVMVYDGRRSQVMLACGSVPFGFGNAAPTPPLQRLVNRSQMVVDLPSRTKIQGSVVDV